MGNLRLFLILVLSSFSVPASQDTEEQKKCYAQIYDNVGREPLSKECAALKLSGEKVCVFAAEKMGGTGFLGDCAEAHNLGAGICNVAAIRSGHSPFILGCDHLTTIGEGLCSAAAALHGLNPTQLHCHKYSSLEQGNCVTAALRRSPRSTTVQHCL